MTGRKIFNEDFYRNVSEQWINDNYPPSRKTVILLINDYVNTTGNEIFTYPEIMKFFMRSRYSDYLQWSTVEREIRKLTYDYYLLDPVDDKGFIIINPVDKLNKKKRKIGRFRVNRNFYIMLKRITKR